MSNFTWSGCLTMCDSSSAERVPFGLWHWHLFLTSADKVSSRTAFIWLSWLMAVLSCMSTTSRRHLVVPKVLHTFNQVVIPCFTQLCAHQFPTLDLNTTAPAASRLYNRSTRGHLSRLTYLMITHASWDRMPLHRLRAIVHTCTCTVLPLAWLPLLLNRLTEVILSLQTVRIAWDLSLQLRLYTASTIWRKIGLNVLTFLLMHLKTHPLVECSLWLHLFIGHSGWWLLLGAH